jgi:prepilin-type N-terminal cleavage/methylation domain-containing protein
MDQSMNTNRNMPAGQTFAFSLLELLVVIAVLGIILFFAFPNIVQVKSDSEKELAKARAETLNLAAAAYFQAVGPTVALSNWGLQTNAEARYNLLKPYIAFPAASISNFLPSTDYSVSFDASAPHKVKANLLGPGSTNIPY